MLRRILVLTIAALGAMSTFACDHDVEPESSEPRSALLFDLTEDELVELHDRYLAEEDIELTRARLTAPFDCSLYDDFCAQVGPEAAAEITGEMVDLARDGVEPAELEDHFDSRVQQAGARLDEVEPEPEPQFRGSGSSLCHSDGNFRVCVQNGITTPIVGDRRAWTKAKAEKKTWLGWTGVKAAQLCVDTGANTQDYSYGAIEVEVESFDPPNTCDVDTKTHEVSTYHDRNNGGAHATYTITVQGCGDGSINGKVYGICTSDYSKDF